MKLVTKPATKFKVAGHLSCGDVIIKYLDTNNEICSYERLVVSTEEAWPNIVVRVVCEGSFDEPKASYYRQSTMVEVRDDE